MLLKQSLYSKVSHTLIFTEGADSVRLIGLGVISVKNARTKEKHLRQSLVEVPESEAWGVLLMTSYNFRRAGNRQNARALSSDTLWALSLCLCSPQLLKEQVAKYTSCFALAGSPPP